MSEAAALRVRPAAAADFPRLRAIYAHHVATGLASFEERPPDLDDMLGRWAAVRDRGLPWLVAESEGEDGGSILAGYAYASPYRARSAYRYTLEDSVYLDPGQTGRGIGKALLARLIAECERGAFRQMIAVIGDSGNEASIALHRRLGFRLSGTLVAVGFKFGRWVDSVLMQRPLGPGADNPPA